ncbi:MAG TPA: DUF354 domain-containing protein [Methanomicrobiales archaeon]|nr:DUF354 domain-containing protein [Methanomicrobiales archaeon]
MREPVKLLVDVAHPAHVHFFRGFIGEMQSRGHEILITARDKEVTLALLDKYGLPYINRGAIQKSVLKKAFSLFQIDAKLWGIARGFNPDILIGIHNPYIAHVAALMRKPSVIFTDTEGVRVASLLTFPFATTIVTPSCFREPVDPGKHVTYRGYKELAYLHPRHFTPDPSSLGGMGLSPGEYVVLRFISWGAIHDTSLRGIRTGSELEFVRSLERFGKVLISSERPLHPDLEKYRIRISPEQIHSLLAFARLYIGEGGTMAAEAAVLGTPAIHIEATRSGEATGAGSGNFLELRDRYQLLYFFSTQEEAFAKALAILGEEGSRETWLARRERLLAEKIDVTSWMTRFIENYPGSLRGETGNGGV